MFRLSIAIIGEPHQALKPPRHVKLYVQGGGGGGKRWPSWLRQAGTSRVRFPMVSLEFFIDIIVSVALWPWGPLSL
jgi:hypothetical protein